MIQNTPKSCIYFDNAATTWPKPSCVLRAVQQAMTIYGANPGRSGYQMALAASRAIYSCREAAASFFNLENPSNVIFTQNCTTALNIVIKGLLKYGGRAVVSDLEHNAVMRPLNAISVNKPIFDIASVTPGDTPKTLESFQRCIKPDTRAIICLHASNVFGIRLPIREIGELAHRHGLKFVVDGAQSAGVLPIDMNNDSIDYLCVPGHKGLYGPMGVGMLVCNSDFQLPTLIEGGTGSLSLELNQPGELPDRFESGTLNTAGICGLHAGIEFVKKNGADSIAEHEINIMKYIYRRLSETKEVILYTACPDLINLAPVLSFNLKGHQSEETAQVLASKGIAVRAGLHCAPCAHRSFGTIKTGTVRLAPSKFTTFRDAQYVCKVIESI
ncbi:MAG: aminotransferase class V-fold PLP-dependent enzyme [Oscillospiraceae bacterium]|nr:aminotransferase class V-fold PLP-dependent enzyme [Oscillospiraceae bacterium]MDD4414162.1 aminotransferase class V-fold PLP-dependent enzyme [Oscillospiraceae bacterium]